MLKREGRGIKSSEICLLKNYVVNVVVVVDVAYKCFYYLARQLDTWTASSAEFGVGPKTRRDKTRTNAARGSNLSFPFSSKEINNAKYNKFRIYQKMMR